MTKKWIAEAIYGLMVLLFMGVSIGIGKESTPAENKSDTKITVTPTVTSEATNTPTPGVLLDAESIPTDQMVVIKDKMEVIQKPELLPEEGEVSKEEAEAGTSDSEEFIDGKMPGAIEINNVNYEQYSNEKNAWWFSRKQNHQPSGSGETFLIAPFSAAYLNQNVTEKDKVIYITFDCGYENGNTPAILDTLAEKNVKALFFVTKNFVTDYPEYVKRMKEEGHLVGNHTVRHLSSPSLSPEELETELSEVAKAMEELTGYRMDPYFRPPMGEYSERVLAAVQDMGYSSVLWSIAYYDYDVNNQPGKDYVVNHFEEYHHNGSIVLMHNTSESNRQALADVLDLLQREGYRFGSVTEMLGGN